MRPQFYIMGHRGAPALAPENTLPSFARAIKEQVNGIECDVHLVDGQLVVIHDDSVDRTSNGTGRIQGFSFNELRELDFGDGAIIPTLIEVIEATPTDILINVELKGRDTGMEVAHVLANYPEHRFMISSFSALELVEFSTGRNSSSNTELALLCVRLTQKSLQQAHQIGAKTLNVSVKFLQKQKVVEAVQRGFRIYVYTVNNVQRAQRLRNWGIAGIFTDNPQSFSYPFDR